MHESDTVTNATPQRKRNANRDMKKLL